MHRLEAMSDFDNQMATFHRFCGNLDLNMDHSSLHGSTIPTAPLKLMK